MLDHDCIGNINQESVEKIVLESLFILNSLLCTGHQEEEKQSYVDMKPRILRICQDILFLAFRGRKLTPKHVRFGPNRSSGNSIKRTCAMKLFLEWTTLLQMMKLKGTKRTEMFLSHETSLRAQTQQATLETL